ncbi:MAG: rhodanese-related sulfurtransferase [Rhizobiaceae bacterium]
MTNITVSALYKFVSLPDYQELQPRIFEACKSQGVLGTLLLAAEGINGTIAGSDAAIRNVLDFLKSDTRFSDLEHKESYCDENPFYRLKVRLKKEIVTMGVAGIDPVGQAGDYVAPDRWNALISDPDTVIIDTRNDYETAIGTFKGAVDPETVNFRDFPKWFRDNKDRFHNKPKIAMYCTGGIRCEKATAFVKAEGFEDVFHLKGGILKYLEEVPESESLWEGECFVFDNRVSVGHGLKQGPYDLCHACRMPISEKDKESPYYIAGVSCPNCHDQSTQARKERFAARQRQIELAKKRGEAHIAADFDGARERKRQERALQIERSKGPSENPKKRLPAGQAPR